jgi:EGF domain
MTITIIYVSFLMHALSTTVMVQSDMESSKLKSLKEVGHVRDLLPMLFVDEDECSPGSTVCSVNAICANPLGSFVCICKDGYRGDGKTCNDIDECAEGISFCSVHATCTNAPGSATCACKAGYNGDGKTCTETDDCLPSNGCSSNAVCSNLPGPGSYDCKCKNGFSGNGRECNTLVYEEVADISWISY